MGVKLFRKPELIKPIMVACWPGIGSIGLIAVDTLKSLLEAEEFGEIEPWDFFYPKRVLIGEGILQQLEFPTSKFYFSRREMKDCLFFIGEEQPSDGGKSYAEGKKAYDMATLVIDVAEQFGCKRIYTSGAAVAPIHHTTRPRVWAAPNIKSLIPEIKRYENTIVMSDMEERGGQGTITGLNGLLLGVARKRGIEGICVMGEIPIYLQGLPIAYPKASRSVLEVLTAAIGITVDLSKLDAFIIQSEKEIEHLYDRFPSEIKEHLEKLKHVSLARTSEPGPITDEDKKKILEDLDKFFKKEPRED